MSGRKLLDPTTYIIKEMTGYCKLEDDTLDLSVWRTGFDRDNGPAVRQYYAMMIHGSLTNMAVDGQLETPALQ